jgi:NADH:ubiquinone oxidoreductase subunit
VICPDCQSMIEAPESKFAEINRLIEEFKEEERAKQLHYTANAVRDIIDPGWSRWMSHRLELGLEEEEWTVERARKEIEEKIEAAYQKGLKEGSSLLKGLADGKLTLDEFQDKIARED